MMRNKLVVLLFCLSLFISGCNFPTDTSFPAPEQPTLVPSPSPQPTDSVLPTSTPADPEPPPLEPTPVPVMDPTFTLQEGGPFYLPNFTHPDDGCNWMGVAGQVFNQAGDELLNLTIIAGGLVEGQEHDRSAITGLTTAYGLGGYEIQLSSQPVDSSGTYWVQVSDQDSNPLSERIYFDTFNDCDRNLVLVNFTPIGEQSAP